MSELAKHRKKAVLIHGDIEEIAKRYGYTDIDKLRRHMQTSLIWDFKATPPSLVSVDICSPTPKRELHHSKRSKPVINSAGGKYPSAKAAAVANHVDIHSIRTAIYNKTKCCGLLWSYCPIKATTFVGGSNDAGF